MLRFYRSLVLPTNALVSNDYIRYVNYSFITNVLISTQSILSTHSMLSVIGKGDTELNVTLNYIGKDLLGQIGGLFYMHKFGKEADSAPKKFVRISMGLQQLSIITECITPLLPRSVFIPIAGLANIGKNISFTGFGAINAKCINKMAIGNNIGEMYGKITVLNTMASSIGMMIGLGLVSYIPDHSTRLVIIPILASIRVWSYNRSIKNLL